jgi:hypothetical protein
MRMKKKYVEKEEQIKRQSQTARVKWTRLDGIHSSQ